MLQIIGDRIFIPTAKIGRIEERSFVGIQNTGQSDHDPLDLFAGSEFLRVRDKGSYALFVGMRGIVDDRFVKALQVLRAGDARLSAPDISNNEHGYRSVMVRPPRSAALTSV